MDGVSADTLLASFSIFIGVVAVMNAACSKSKNNIKAKVEEEEVRVAPQSSSSHTTPIGLAFLTTSFRLYSQTNAVKVRDDILHSFLAIEGAVTDTISSELNIVSRHEGGAGEVRLQRLLKFAECAKGDLPLHLRRNLSGSFVPRYNHPQHRAVEIDYDYIVTEDTEHAAKYAVALLQEKKAESTTMRQEGVILTMGQVVVFIKLSTDSTAGISVEELKDLVADVGLATFDTYKTDPRTEFLRNGVTVNNTSLMAIWTHELAMRGKDPLRIANHCCGCGKEFGAQKEVKWCKCKVGGYCSKACYKKDWGMHKKACKAAYKKTN
jgi:hypothetical protein